MSRIRLVVLILALVGAGVFAGRAWPGAGPQAVLAAPTGPDVTALGAGGPVDSPVPRVPQGGGCAGCLYKVYAPNRFAPTRSDLTFQIIGGAIVPTALPGTVGFMAPLDLPNGASVQQVTFYYEDTSTTNDMHFKVMRYDAASLGSGYTSIETADSSGASAGVRSLILSTVFGIDSAASDYILDAIPTETNGPHKIWGAVVAYRVTSAVLPMIVR